MAAGLMEFSLLVFWFQPAPGWAGRLVGLGLRVAGSFAVVRLEGSEAVLAHVAFQESGVGF